jgi:hypothetical protein
MGLWVVMMFSIVLLNDLVRLGNRCYSMFSVISFRPQLLNSKWVTPSNSFMTLGYCSYAKQFL